MPLRQRTADAALRLLGGVPLGIVLKPVSVYERATLLATLKQFKQARIEIALVFDEYGALQGIVRQTDLLEAIAGDLPESGVQETGFEKLDEHTFRMDGVLSIYGAKARLGIEPPVGPFHTLAGFVLHLFGRVPKAGERVEWGEWRFEVLEVDGQRLSKLLVRRAADKAGAPDAGSGWRASCA